MSATTSTNIMPSIVFNCYLALLMEIRAVIAICFDLTGRQRFKITFYYVLPMLLLVSLRKKRTAKRLNVTNVTGLLLACFVRNSPNIDVFCSSTKRSVQRNVKFGGRFFETRLLSRLSHKVYRRLSSLALLHKFIIVVIEHTTKHEDCV